MPKRSYDCGNCGDKNIPRNTYYRLHHNDACLAAAVAAVRKRQKLAAEGPPALEDTVQAPEAGEQEGLQVPDDHHDELLFQAVDDPTAGAFLETKGELTIPDSCRQMLWMPRSPV